MRATVGRSSLISLFVACWSGTSAAQTPAQPQPAVPALPRFDGTAVALGDAAAPAGVVDLDDCTTTDQAERGRNTYSFAVLSPENGWDLALADLAAAYPGFAGVSKLAKIAVVEGNFLIADPPLSTPLPFATTDARRIVRGSGGLRLGLVHDGDPELETAAFSHWTSEPSRTFVPKAGLIQMAESLAVQQPAKYGFLAGILPPEAREISVRQVRAFRGPNDRPWLVVGCSVQTAAVVFDQASGDDAWARQAQRNRVFEWVTSPTPGWVDASATRFANWSDTAYWEQNTWGVGLGDLNDDGTTDVVFGNYGFDFWGAHNQILLSDAAGNFQPLVIQDPFPFLDVTTDVVVADLNADGLNDVAVANRWRSWGALDSNDNWAAFAHDILSGDYVVFGTGTVTDPQSALAQPTFTSRVRTEDDHARTVHENYRDTVALDVGDVDHDGDLDVLAGNHGVPGLPFVEDNATCDDVVLNRDAVYRLVVPPGFPGTLPYFLPPWDLPASGGDGQLTTDIVFHDVTRPVVYAIDTATSQGLTDYGTWSSSAPGVTPVFGPGQPGASWHAFAMVNPPASGDGTWPLVEVRDGWLDVTRVARSREGSRVTHYVNDPGMLAATPRAAFGEVWDVATSTWTKVVPGWSASIPDVAPLYGGSFFAMHHSWASPDTHQPAGIGAVAPAGEFGAPNGYSRLMYTNELLDFVNAIATADFAPDKRFTAAYQSGVHWPSPPDPANKRGYPDLLLGFGYELSGVPNRLYPFCTWQTVQRVGGGEMLGVSWHGGRGGSWTAGWTEKSNKGYGVGLIDVENDGDLDAITAHRTGARLYENQGPGAEEGRFERVTSTQRWPATDIPYAHSLLFREDSCTGDFDGDGDLDAFLVGFAGREDYRNGNTYARGERDEDTARESWLHNQAAQNRMLQGTQFLENLTLAPGGGTPGHFALRSDRLDFAGRVEAEQGGDRAIAADFDGDGWLDMLEPRWLIIAPDVPGYAVEGGDPVLASHWSALDYDFIAQHRGLLFRYWRNAGDPQAATWFTDEAWSSVASAGRVRCKEPGTGAEHFGTLDARGAPNHAQGSQFAPLHRRVNHGIAAGDFNNDGTVDVLVSYHSWPDGQQNGYNLFLTDAQGVMWDSTVTPSIYGAGNEFLPDWSHPDVAGGGAPVAPDSFALAANDYDLDGDVDLFLGFHGWHDMALLRNDVAGGGPLPVHPSGPSLPSARFHPRATSGASDWLQGELDQMNFPWLGPGQHQPQGVFWTLPIDADHDGDQDLVSFTTGSAHLFWMNRTRDSIQPGDHFLDRSADQPYAPSCTVAPKPAQILAGMRITSHPGPTPVDLEAGDLDGDSVPDFFAGYTSRPDAPYFGRWVGASPIDPAVPYVSKVFPELGVRAGGKFRVYGTQMTNVRKVELVFGPDAAPTAVVTVNPTAGQGTITPGPGSRYLDVTLPAGPLPVGPCGIRLLRSGVPSPVWRNTCFALLQ